MAKIQSHRELIVWQKAMDLAVEVYRLSEIFPKAELYRLVSQLTETFIMLAVRLNYVTQRQAERAFGLIAEISKMLTAIRARLNR